MPERIDVLFEVNKNQRNIIIRSDGRAQELLTSEVNDPVSKHTLHDLVDGALMRLRTLGYDGEAQGAMAVVNAQGRERELPHNPRASRLVGQDVFGDAVFVQTYKLMPPRS